LEERRERGWKWEGRKRLREEWKGGKVSSVGGALFDEVW